MTLELTLPAELEARLHREAKRQGLSEGAIALQLLEKHLPPTDGRAETIALLRSWIDAEDSDEPDPDYDLFQALDAARTSDRKLFPNELKGESW